MEVSKHPDTRGVAEKTAGKGTTGRSGSLREAVAEGGWTTVNKKREGARNGNGRQGATPRSPGRVRADWATEGRLGSGGGRWSPTRSVGSNDGREVFRQLKTYCLSDAKAGYILPLVEKLAYMAATRRFQEYKESLPTERTEGKSEQEVRAEWGDELPSDMRTKYAGLVSYWDLSDEVHANRLAMLMKDWVIDSRLPQHEVEARLRVMHMEHSRPAPVEEQSKEAEARSYRGVVNEGLRSPEIQLLTPYQQRLKELCLKPAKVLTQLRPRTPEEDAALLMILNQEIEVPGPPPFLVQSMTAGEIARFTDLFLGIEYSLYAHLAPGQWFGENLSKQAIIALVQGGTEAAPLHKMETTAFKETLSRITLDMETRVITVTFKGRSVAQKWVGWSIPLAGKMLPLIDYEMERGQARVNHELVNLDCYVFTAEVKRGKITSTDLHWILDTSLDLHVCSMVHPEAGKGSINDKRWTVTIAGACCPRKLRNIATLKTGEAEITIWHHMVHVSRPCSNCLSPNHQTKYCRESVGSVEARRRSVGFGRGFISALRLYPK
ncbi:hypothetical protein PR001_g11415 [Phytophthora rubi]|uniref:Uncharacterized protein n=2 Tax=Phytophthora rubi TaxID=129364 RepID=A0A6A3MG83_9STRA|nr:hypothetical protein PR001_g11415 [Phytophthora rubi]